MKKILTTTLVSLSLLFGCTNNETPAPQDEITSMTYKVTYQGTWTANSHPIDYPSNSHFSGAIGMTHKKGISLFQEGTIATEGIKIMAETGGKTPLQDEIQTIIDNGNAKQIISQPVLTTGTSAVEFEITLDTENNCVSIVSMIAPSPDWFIAIEALQLYVEGKWIEDITIDPIHYDAGTDNGTTFTSDNSPSSPIVNIFEITTSPLGNGQSVNPSTATFRFQKQ